MNVRTPILFLATVWLATSTAAPAAGPRVAGANGTGTQVPVPAPQARIAQPAPAALPLAVPLTKAPPPAVSVPMAAPPAAWAAATPATAAALETRRLIADLRLQLEEIERKQWRLSRTRLVRELDKLEGMLKQLRGRPLQRQQQIALFKTEMRVLALRRTLMRAG